MFQVPHSKKFIEKSLNKNYRKINYNQFRWWRWYDSNNKPLPTKADFRDKIFNGDLILVLMDYKHNYVNIY